MKCRKAYAIIPVGENDRSAHVAQQKAPEVATPGLFYSVLGGWLNPKAGYQLYFPKNSIDKISGQAKQGQYIILERKRCKNLLIRLAVKARGSEV